MKKIILLFTLIICCANAHAEIPTEAAEQLIQDATKATLASSGAGSCVRDTECVNEFASQIRSRLAAADSDGNATYSILDTKDYWGISRRLTYICAELVSHGSDFIKDVCGTRMQKVTRDFLLTLNLK